MTQRDIARIGPAPTAFEVHREETQARATLEFASELAKRATERAAKGASLLGTASALPHRRNTLRSGPDGWLAAVRDAHALLGQVLAEVEQPDEAPVIKFRAAAGLRAGHRGER